MFDALVHPGQRLERRWFERDGRVTLDLDERAYSLWDHYDVHRIATSTIAPGRRARNCLSWDYSLDGDAVRWRWTSNEQGGCDG